MRRARSTKPSMATYARKSAKEEAMEFERYKLFKELVDVSAKNHRVFAIWGSFPAAKRALMERGWIEKLPARVSNISNDSRTHYPRLTNQQTNRQAQGNNATNRRTSNVSRPSICRNYYGWPEHLLRPEDPYIISRNLHRWNIKPDFLWTTDRTAVPWKELPREQLVSVFPTANFTTKIGLCRNLRDMHWFSEFGASDFFYPRCYVISDKDERRSFVDDFRLTACFNFLKWFMQCTRLSGGAIKLFPTAKKPGMPATQVEFALQKCRNFMGSFEHDDIDTPLDTRDPKVVQKEWRIFLFWYYKLVHENDRIEPTPVKTVKLWEQEIEVMLPKIEDRFPQLFLDGTKNLWIVKPAARSKGQGIRISSNLDRLLRLPRKRFSHKLEYVVQKYIEYPLLIYNTKFDIRQWFLITDWFPLTIWMYQECYLRFCSRPYSLANLHESIHLSNNAIQRNYRNANHTKLLPRDHMWDSKTFQEYLVKEGYPDVWDKDIYPKMCDAIVGALLASQEHITERKNCFELYGADFMLTANFDPWLIEINGSPALSPSTSVTAKMAPICQRDIIKVVFDTRYDELCDTGNFDLLYRQEDEAMNRHVGQKFLLTGTKVRLRRRARQNVSQPTGNYSQMGNNRWG